MNTIVNSVRKTGRAVTVEEGWPQHGVGAEIIAQLNERMYNIERDCLVVFVF